MKKFLGLLILTSITLAGTAKDINSVLAHAKDNINAEAINNKTKHNINRIYTKARKALTSKPFIRGYSALGGLALVGVTGAASAWINKKSLPYALGGAAALGSFYVYPKLYRYLYSKTDQGKAETRLETSIKQNLNKLITEIKAMSDDYGMDFQSTQNAELCSKKMFPSSNWPLVDLHEEISNYFQEIKTIGHNLSAVEKHFSKQQTITLYSENKYQEVVAADYFKSIKDVVVDLSLCLSDMINYIITAQSYKEQEVRHIAHQNKLEENEQRQKDRDIAQAAGDFQYQARYGNK